MKTRIARRALVAVEDYVGKYTDGIPVDWLSECAETIEEEALSDLGYAEGSCDWEAFWETFEEQVRCDLFQKGTDYLDFIAENYPEEFKDGSLEAWLKTR